MKDFKCISTFHNKNLFHSQYLIIVFHIITLINHLLRMNRFFCYFFRLNSSYSHFAKNFLFTSFFKTSFLPFFLSNTFILKFFSSFHFSSFILRYLNWKNLKNLRSDAYDFFFYENLTSHFLDICNLEPF